MVAYKRYRRREYYLTSKRRTLKSQSYDATEAHRTKVRTDKKKKRKQRDQNIYLQIQCTPKKRVSFSDECIYHPVPSLVDLLHLDLYWSRYDYAVFKAEATLEMKTERLKKPNLSTRELLTKLYQPTCEDIQMNASFLRCDSIKHAAEQQSPLDTAANDAVGKRSEANDYAKFKRMKEKVQSWTRSISVLLVNTSRVVQDTLTGSIYSSANNFM